MAPKLSLKEDLNPEPPQMTEAMKNLQNLGQQRKFTKMIILFLASFYQELPKKGVLSELNVVLMDKMINLYSSEI